MAEYSIGVDLGGTNLRAAAIDRSGKMLDKISGETDFTAGRDAVLGDIVAAIAKLRDKHGAGGLAGIGVGVPGFIRMKEGLITGSNNLPFLENVPVRDDLSRRLGTKVILENDANAAALGEKWIGAGRDVDDLVLLTLGTGIGGGIISGGRIVRGQRGNGRRIGAHLRGGQRQSVRLRQSGLPGEARVGVGRHGHGEADAPGRRALVEGRLRSGEDRRARRATRRGTSGRWWAKRSA